jgi:hypothetical protein
MLKIKIVYFVGLCGKKMQRVFTVKAGFDREVIDG